MGRVYVDEASKVAPDGPIASIFRPTANNLLMRIAETLTGLTGHLPSALYPSQHRCKVCRSRRRGSPADI